MNKKLITLLLAAGIAVIFVTTSLHAGTEFKDTFIMDTKGYKKKTKGAPKYKAIEFNHKKHTEEYGVTCGECHHDKDNKPLDLKIGDDVKGCAECHNKFKKDKNNKKDIMVHQNAMHANCVGCHKAFNKEKGDPKGMKGPAPASCTKCHKKAK
ncbi:MAG: cytochrome c3 family protein [Desulfobacula sp.]|nr:cytochrome c3 family protein [Desulfobacula sp.]